MAAHSSVLSVPNSLSDLLHAARTLSRARAFTAVCVVSLGLGMGVVIGILLMMRLVTATPPRVNDKGLVELVIRPSGQLRAQAGSAIIDTWSFPDYLDVRDAASGMAMSGWSRGEGLYQPEDTGPGISVSTMYVSSNYFSTIGVTLPRGPGFTKVDDASRAEPEAVIGHRVWQVRFNGDPNIVGRRVKINQTDYVVVGVTPDDFRGHTSGLNDAYYQLWLPLSRHPRLMPRPASAWRGMPHGSASSRGCLAARPWRRQMRWCNPRSRRSQPVIRRARRTRPAASSRTSHRARVCDRRSASPASCCLAWRASSSSSSA